MSSFSALPLHEGDGSGYQGPKTGGGCEAVSPGRVPQSSPPSTVTKYCLTLTRGRTCTFLHLPNNTPSHCLMGGSPSQLSSLQLPLSSDTPQTSQYLTASLGARRTHLSALLKSGMSPWLTLASDVSGGPVHHIEVGVFTGRCAVPPAPIPLPW